MRHITILLLIFPVAVFCQVNKNCQKTNHFSTVRIYDGILATLEKGEESYICPGPDTRLSKLSITLEDGSVKIRKVPGTAYEKPPKIKIVYTELSQIEGYGKADIDVKNLIKRDDLKVILKSGASLYADLDVKRLELEASEGSLFKSKGYAVEQKLTLTLKATFSGFELEGDKGEVKATSGGTAKVNLEKRIKAHATTGGQIRYKGSPSVESRQSLGGKILEDED